MKRQCPDCESKDRRIALLEAELAEDAETLRVMARSNHELRQRIEAVQRTLRLQTEAENG